MIFDLWWNLAIRIQKPLWQLCGFPTGSLFSITMSPEVWDSFSLFVNLAYSWHGLGWGLGTLSLFWMGQKPCKTTKLPWKITEQNMTMKIPWKIMEQTITMKSHKANLTKNRKQPKTKKHLETPWNAMKPYWNLRKPAKNHEATLEDHRSHKPWKTIENKQKPWNHSQNH